MNNFISSINIIILIYSNAVKHGLLELNPNREHLVAEASLSHELVLYLALHLVLPGQAYLTVAVAT